MTSPPDDPTHTHLPRTEHLPLKPVSAKSLPVTHDEGTLVLLDARAQMDKACHSWLHKSMSRETRSNYQRDLKQFMIFSGIQVHEKERLATVTPEQVTAWRDDLMAEEYTNSSIRRKLTVLRSLFSYLQSYGFTGANPAHSDFVDAPSVPSHGKTVAVSRQQCRDLLDAIPADTPVGIRDRAMLAILAYTGCRVGELTRLRVGSYKTDGDHKILEIHGKGGKERKVPLPTKAIKRLDHWLAVLNSSDDPAGPMFRPLAKSRKSLAGFARRPLTRRSVQLLVERLVAQLNLDPNVTVHSFRVTAITTASEEGCDLVALQEFAGHADPRTTISYIRRGDCLSESPAYSLKY